MEPPIFNPLDGRPFLALLLGHRGSGGWDCQEAAAVVSGGGGGGKFAVEATMSSLGGGDHCLPST
jgi:hypothetical protein